MSGEEAQPGGINDAGVVKKFSKDQRDALPGEPFCAVCGRYGEYVCDSTDDDVCSLECKAVLLVKRETPQTRLPVADECYYVRDTPGQSSFSNLPPDQVDFVRERLDILVKGHAVPAPVLSFYSCNIPRKLLNNLEAAGYDMPTPAQMQSIPALLAGRNMIVSASTGSGKTASYLIPIISLCANWPSIQIQKSHSPRCRTPLAIVLAPTRELCIQIEDEAKLLGKGLQFKTALVVGGDALAGQIHRICQGVELIVGTPGRLIDLLSKYDVKLDDVRIFVLDEVDCLLQKGFREQVLQIFIALSQPQLFMCSATISSEVGNMASSLARDFVYVSIGQPNEPNKAVRQTAIWVESKQKKRKLFEILMSKQHFRPPAVVYVGSRLGADLLSNAITVTTGLKAFSIHGEKTMKERREVMSSFLVGEVAVLVSTGILGRGLDLFSVRQVIIFDMPNSISEYIHQIGRASRIGEEGTAIVFVNDENKNLFPEFVDILKSSGAPVPRELLNSRYALRSSVGIKSSRKRKQIS